MSTLVSTECVDVDKKMMSVLMDQVACHLFEAGSFIPKGLLVWDQGGMVPLLSVW